MAIITHFQRIPVAALTSAVLFLLACTASSAAAQQVDQMTAEHRRWHADALATTDADRAEVARIFDEYSEAVERLRDVLRQCLEVTRGIPAERTSGQPPAGMKDRDRPLTWHINRYTMQIQPLGRDLGRELQTAYFDRLRAAFPDRRDRVDSLQRAWRRESQIGRLPNSRGADIDLVRLVDRVIDDDALRAAVQSALDAWESEFDALLLAYEQVQDSQRRHEALRQAQAGEIGMKELTEVLAEPTILTGRMARLNERTRRNIQTLLPPDEAAAFERAWYEQKYPFVWTRADETAVIQSRLDRDGVDEPTRRRLSARTGEIDRLRHEITRRLDEHLDALLEEESIRDFYAEYAAYLLDRSLPYPKWPEQEAFRKAGAEFLGSMEAIGAELGSAEAPIDIDLSWSSTAFAADDDPWIRRIFTPAFTPDVLAEALEAVPDLSDAQRSVIQSIHEDYLAEFEQKSRGYRAEIARGTIKRERQRDGRNMFHDPNAAMQRSRQQAQRYDARVQLTWRAERPVLELSFEDDVAAVLEEDQANAWRAFGRHLRRQEYLATGDDRTAPFAIATTSDLVDVVAALELPPQSREAIREALTDFELEVDRFLRETIPRLARGQLEAELAERAGAEDAEAIQRAVYEAHSEARLAVSDICVRHYRRIRGLLPPEHAAKFEDIAGAELWPSAYGPTPADIGIEALREEPNLPFRIIEAVERIAREYRESSRPISRRLAAVAHKIYVAPASEEQRAEYEARRQAFQDAVKNDPDGYHILQRVPTGDFRERLILVQKTCRQLRRLFSDAEFERLPAHVRLALGWAAAE